MLISTDGARLILTLVLVLVLQLRLPLYASKQQVAC